MLTVYLNQDDLSYPAALRSYLGEDVPASISALGNLDILKQSKLAIFCSAECPAELILQTHNLIETALAPGVTVMSGFHSPGERECLSIFLRGIQPIIICPARSLTKMRIRTQFKNPLDEGRLLFLSCFRSHRHRSDVHMALSRNRFVAAIADRILVLYAAPASKTETFCREIVGWKKPLFALASDLNQNLIALGAKPLDPRELGNWNYG
jgi:predicted Rossmann fold nucleotide-binding protein DprA/Smf involved in DNA uptake